MILYTGMKLQPPSNLNWWWTGKTCQMLPT